MKKSDKNRFSLIELLVVFAILAILFSLLSANLSKLTQTSHLNQCQTHLKTIYMATQVYINDNDSFLPGPLLAGQHPTVGSFALAGYLAPYLQTMRRSDNRRDILPELMCPSNRLDSSSIASDRRLHYRTHIDKDSSVFFGYPHRRDPMNVSSIERPSIFKWFRDLSKVEFTNPDRLPGWYHLLSDYPSHFNTDYNQIYFDGKIEAISALP